jgi:hypothetical protein
MGEIKVGAAVNASDFPALYREAWAVYEAMRKLGFQDDDVVNLAAPTVLPNGQPSTVDYLFVCLKAQGQQFNVTIGPLDRPFPEAQEEVRRLRAAIADHAISEPELQKMWEQSKMGDVVWFGAFATKLIERGFVLPALTN